MSRIAAGVLAACIASAAVQPLLAQDDDAVVITATRFLDSRRDLPVGVTLITAEDIRRSASSNLTEILAQFGLVHIRDNTGTPNQGIDLRGFGITGDQNTLVLVDGIRLSENELTTAQLSTLPLDMIERIEIVRGGGAVLYGGGAVGGTINIITRRAAPGERRAYASARGGGYGTKELRAGYRSMGESIGFALDAAHEDTEGYRRNNRFRQATVSGLLEARGQSGRAYLRTTLGWQDLALPGALTEAQIIADRRQAGAVRGYTSRDDLSLVAGGSMKSGRNEWAADISYRHKQNPSSFPGFDVDTRVDLFALQPRAKVRFDAMGREHDLTVGIDVENWDLDSVNTFGMRTGDQKSVAAYALANLWMAERTRLVLGARLQQAEVSLAPDAKRHDLSALEAALRHRIGGGWSAYGKLGTAFRLATFDEICFAACAGPLLDPQRSLNREAGAEFEARGVRFRAAVYAMTLKDEIYFSPLLFDNVNLSPTRRRGLELEGAWRAAPTLELRGGLAFQQAKFRTGVYGGTDVSGRDVPLVPEILATAGASWELGAGRRLNLNGRYVGEQRYDNDQDNRFRKMPDYLLLDAKLEQKIGKATLALELRNIFDKEYYSYGIRNGAATTFNAYPQPERALYASLAWRLD